MNETLIAEEKDVKVYLKAALNIGKYLAKEAIWYKDMCNWTGHEVCGINGQYVNAVKSCGIDFYSGLSGIALFLTEVYTVTKNQLILHTLNGALNSIQHNIQENTLNNYGYYSGKIGLGFALWKIGRKLKRETLSKQGLQLIKSVQKLPITEHEIDVVSGAAGSIPVLLKLYYQEKDDAFLEMAKTCGQFLLEKAVINKDMYSWKTVDPTFALTGFSHGASGIASALLELFATTKQEDYWHAAMGGFRYEKSWFNEQTQNWPDLRQYTGEGTPAYGLMWCHGAPGIAIALLKAWEMTGQEFFLHEAKTALATTSRGVLNELQPKAMANFSLCHGLAGNADILLYGADVLNDPSLREMAIQVGEYGINHYDSTHTLYPSGVNDPSKVTPGQQENPGLMLGLSGTGMFYLRLFNSKTTPSVLVP